ncbi:MAG: hypothetical protein JW854_02410 [Actinobacteria bacterium]|nr:hypothetical protein [Actinomycetota bacterium]
MKEKYYSQYLLRALDGEELRLDEELSGLVDLGERLRRSVPVVPPLAGDARSRIWNMTVSAPRETAVEESRVRRIPRLAWAGAAALVLAVIAVLVVVFVGNGGPVTQEPVKIASLYVEQGEITIKDVRGEERSARDGEAISAGEVIYAAADARGIVEYSSGCIMRLQGEAEIGVYDGEDGLVAEVFGGYSYHRVIDGTPYVVRSGGVEVTARGTAFSFDVAEGTGRVISLHSSVRIAVDTDDPEDWTSRLEEGDIFVYGEGIEAKVLDVTREDLDSEWLRWNKSLDEALGLPIGAFTLLEEVAEGGQEAQPEQPEQPEGPAAEEEEPQPSPEPPAPEPPAPQPPAPEPPPVEKSLVLSASAREGAVDFAWTLSGYGDFQGFKLCRSESNMSPSYPGDWWMYIDGASTRSTTDSSVEIGHTYYYRLAVYNQGAVLGYSNTVTVTVPGTIPELSISLSGKVEGGKVVLNWSVGGDGSYSGFKVCRSETNPNPSYPEDSCTFVDASARSHTDTGVASGKTYYYRVGIYRDGTIVKYSNAVKVVVP